jgi:tRNA pseudouridine38-40 synthase
VTRIRITLQYDGTDYVGWQVQPNGPSVQAALQKALAEVCGAEVRATAAGRTDAGVHARAQVASFESPRELPLKAYVQGLNALLPRDIAVLDAQVAAPDFDARRAARGKRYVYTIWNGPVRAPLRMRYAWCVFRELSLAPMREAAASLLGRHDFAAFEAADSEAEHAVREVREISVEGEAGAEVRIAVEATAFVKHMVRNLVGTLVEVGHGKRAPADVGRVLASRDRTQAGPTAPPQGLCLWEVSY